MRAFKFSFPNLQPKVERSSMNTFGYKFEITEKLKLF